MARLDAPVNATRQRLVAGETTGDLSDIARDVTPQLVTAMTALLCEDGARRTLRLTVARVLHLQVPTHTLYFCQTVYFIKTHNNGRHPFSMHPQQPSLKVFMLAYSEPSPKIGRVATGRACGIKYLGLHGWAYSRSRLCGYCRPASGHTVRGVTERGPVINRGPHHIQN